MKRFKVPVALFNFNRPQLSRRVFEVIRQIKPERLLLVADGPRKDRPDDERLCAEVRSIFDEIDWECEVSTNFADSNLGSFKRNSSGLDWVFNTVEEAIILEDDCIPSLSFFSYCEELLELYREDHRISVISGNNFVSPCKQQRNASYFFSAYPLTWGWASWRRVWQQVDLNMSWWEPVHGEQMLRKLFSRHDEWQYWLKLFEAIRVGERRNAWDYQLILSSFRYSQYCIIPRVNLVSNIGCGADATNCKWESAPFANVPNGELGFPLRHPSKLSRNEQVDHRIFRVRMASLPPVLYQRIFDFLTRKVKLIFESKI